MNKKKKQHHQRRNRTRPSADRQARLAAVQSQQRSTERKRNTLIFGGIGMAVTAIIIAVIIVIVGQVRQNNGLSDLAAGNIEGVQTSENLTKNHVQGAVEYGQSPPVGGDHNPVWTNCGVYTEPLPNTNTVHSLEHGAAWITYQPELDQTAISALTDLVGTRSHVLLSPDPGQDSPIKASAWGLQLSIDSVEDQRLAAFLEKYIQGEQTPEPGATCSGGIDPAASN